jgi:flagellar biosynthesis/type III secretory pathway protein FliH
MSEHAGRNKHGRFIKHNDPMKRILSIEDFNLLEICDKPLTYHDNAHSNIIHQKLHSRQEIAEGVRISLEIESEFPREDRPVIRPLDFTEEWKRQKKRHANRHHRFDEDEDLDLDMQSLVKPKTDPKESPVTVAAPLVEPSAPTEAIPPPHVTQATSRPSVEAPKPVEVAPSIPQPSTGEPRRFEETFVPLTSQLMHQVPEIDQAELEAIREAARAEGYQQGFSIGEQKGTLEAQHKVEAIIHELGSVMDNLQGMQKSILNQVQDNFVTLCQSFIESLLHKEFKLNPESFGRIIERALAEALPEDDFKVLVSPAMYPGLVQWAEQTIHGRIKADESLDTYQFRIEGRHAVVDAHVNDIIKNLLDQADIELFDPVETKKEQAS